MKRESRSKPVAASSAFICIANFNTKGVSEEGTGAILGVGPGSPLPENPEKLAHVCYYSVYSQGKRRAGGACRSHYCLVSIANIRRRFGIAALHVLPPLFIRVVRACVNLHGQSLLSAGALASVCVMGKGAQGPTKVKVGKEERLKALREAGTVTVSNSTLYTYFCNLHHVCMAAWVLYVVLFGPRPYLLMIVGMFLYSDMYVTPPPPLPSCTPGYTPSWCDDSQCRLSAYCPNTHASRPFMASHIEPPPV